MKVLIFFIFLLLLPCSNSTFGENTVIVIQKEKEVQVLISQQKKTTLSLSWEQKEKRVFKVIDTEKCEKGSSGIKKSWPFNSPGEYRLVLSVQDIFICKKKEDLTGAEISAKKIKNYETITYQYPKSSSFFDLLWKPKQNMEGK